MRLLVQKLDPAAKLPVCAHPGQDLGYDLFALEDTVLEPGVPTAVRTGIAAYYGPYGGECGMLIRDRSSMAKVGIAVTGGVVDAGYRGEIVVILTNLRQPEYVLVDWIHNPAPGREPALLRSDVRYHIKASDKIAQMIPLFVRTYAAVEEVDELPKGERGTAGFGSTGR